MQLIHKSIPKNCDIALLGDDHRGNYMSSLTSLDEALNWVMEKRNRYYCKLGDAIEAQTVDDGRFDPRTNDEPVPLQQANDCIAHHQPTSSRCLCWLEGNHEFKLQRFGNIAEYMANSLKVPYGTAACKLILWTGDKLVGKFWLQHPHRGQLTSQAKDYEQALANMQANLKKKLRENASDCVLQAAAHYHKLTAVPPPKKLCMTDNYVEPVQTYLTGARGDETYIEPDRRWYVATGSFLRLYGEMGVSGYAERANYDPIEIGYPIVHIRRGFVNDVSTVTL